MLKNKVAIVTGGTQWNWLRCGRKIFDKMEQLLYLFGSRQETVDKSDCVP